MIGILYSARTLNRMINGKSFEKPAFYVEAAHKAGEEIVFFSVYDINWKRGTVWGWDGTKRVRLKKVLPQVIINRTRTNTFHYKNTICRLKQMGKTIFNEQNVVSKLDIHNILVKNPMLLPHLPATSSVTHHAVEQLFGENTSLFLKPRTASVGDGIIRIRKKDNNMIAEINVLGRTLRKKVSIDQIIDIVRKKKRRYLVQQGVSLMPYQGNPVDFRVSMQKNGSGCWQYTGMVGKVAKKGAIVTNLHCGGTSMKASELFAHWGWDGAEIERKVVELGLRIVQTLDKELSQIADLGLDIAVDEQQHPWFIEANFRDMRVTFRDAGEKETWQSSYSAPVNYAAYLIGQLNEREDQHQQQLNGSG
ncbi:YheC/YheD family endospore coat-associated protein [Paenibacillus agricola]|uniref:YheC/YheD family protein n=1 Tax=Paenibacillus agricola TaxID=2716264 RepID=A0ABX0J1S6_9BACL|nr:YheC/YheD family protein [Paenibacillus agricola]NHN30194.1 YheC/YheD family protein [Paenibacillus agricola]